jgi:hypothetical protein
LGIKWAKTFAVCANSVNFASSKGIKISIQDTALRNVCRIKDIKSETLNKRSGLVIKRFGIEKRSDRVLER